MIRRRTVTGTASTREASVICTGSRPSAPISPSSSRTRSRGRHPASSQSAPATNTTILTDGVVGSPVTGSFAYWLGQCWSSEANVDLRVDLGQLRTTGAFRAHLFGSPGWDALKGQVLDRIEVLTSLTASRTPAADSWERRCGRRTFRSTTCCRTTRRRRHGISSSCFRCPSRPGTSRITSRPSGSSARASCRSSIALATTRSTSGLHRHRRLPHRRLNR